MNGMTTLRAVLPPDPGPPPPLTPPAARFVLATRHVTEEAAFMRAAAHLTWDDYHVARDWMDWAHDVTKRQVVAIATVSRVWPVIDPARAMIAGDVVDEAIRRGLMTEDDIDALSATDPYDEPIRLVATAEATR